MMLQMIHRPTGENRLLFIELAYRDGCYTASVNDRDLPHWVDPATVEAFLELEAIYGHGRHLEDDIQLALIPSFDKVTRLFDDDITPHRLAS